MACITDRIKQKSYEKQKIRSQVLADAEQKNVGLIKSKMGNGVVFEFEITIPKKKYFEVVKFRDNKSEDILQDTGTAKKERKKTTKPVKSEEKKD